MPTLGYQVYLMENWREKKWINNFSLNGNELAKDGSLTIDLKIFMKNVFKGLIKQGIYT